MGNKITSDSNDLYMVSVSINEFAETLADAIAGLKSPIRDAGGEIGLCTLKGLERLAEATGGNDGYQVSCAIDTLAAEVARAGAAIAKAITLHAGAVGRGSTDAPWD